MIFLEGGCRRIVGDDTEVYYDELEKVISNRSIVQEDDN